VARIEGDQLSPAQPGLDEGLDHQSVVVRDRLEEPVELVGGQRAGFAGDGLGELDVGARVVHQDPVAHRLAEDRGEKHVVLADRAGCQPVALGLGHPVLDQ
jgi:hypothetical protein